MRFGGAYNYSVLVRQVSEFGTCQGIFRAKQLNRRTFERESYNSVSDAKVLER